MLKKKKEGRKTKAISPAIAAIILIAITIAIAIAVAGWVFGIFGGAATHPKVTIVTATFDWDPVGSSSTISFTLTNTGTAATTAVAASVTVGGVNWPLALTGAPIALPPDGSTVPVVCTGSPTSGVSEGQAYTLIITLGDGTQLPYEGITV